MYNLFVCGHAGSWSGDPWTVERSRCINTDEHTDGDVAERFGDLDTAQIRELCGFPCIFAFEGWEKAPKFGFLRDVIVLRSRAEVKVKYELIEVQPRFLTADELEELQTQLAIITWERRRTHWAVKDVDLDRVLLDAKGISLPRKDDVASKFDPSAQSATNDDLWKPAAAPRLFMSHLAARKEEVHDLSNMLKQFGFACFVAHDAIEPSREWRREIERALDSCDVLVAYVTPEFSASHWTDQEIGWALGAAWPPFRFRWMGKRLAGSLAPTRPSNGPLRCRTPNCPGVYSGRSAMPCSADSGGISSGCREDRAARDHCPRPCEFNQDGTAVP